MSAITIGEEILLLALDDDTGRLNVALRDRRIGVALLMDLALNDRIDTDLRELFVVSSEPLGEPVLDGALARIAGERERRSTDHWVDVFADGRDAVLRQVAGRLVERGIAIRDRYDRLLVMGGTGGGRPARDVRRRIAGVLMSDEIPDPRDIMIIGLIDTCSLWGGLIDEAALARLAPRIRQVARMDLIGQAVARVMNRRQA